MSISLKSIADKANKHKEALKGLEAQNKEYWLSSLYTLLECPKIIAEHFVSCAQKGLYECRISRGWLYSKIKERNNSFDLGVESDEFVLLYLFCLKNIIETYEEKYDILCYGAFYHNKGYITPELKVNWKSSETKDKTTWKNIPNTTKAINSLSCTGIFLLLSLIFQNAIFVTATIIFLIIFSYFAIRLCIKDFVELDSFAEINTNKNVNNDIRQFDGIYEAMLTVTKEQELKEVYTKITNIISLHKNTIEPNETKTYPPMYIQSTAITSRIIKF